jgi:hypothetical protein
MFWPRNVHQLPTELCIENFQHIHVPYAQIQTLCAMLRAQLLLANQREE